MTQQQHWPCPSLPHMRVTSCHVTPTPHTPAAWWMTAPPWIFRSAEWQSDSKWWRSMAGQRESRACPQFVFSIISVLLQHQKVLFEPPPVFQDVFTVLEADWQDFCTIYSKNTLENTGYHLSGLGKLSWWESKAFLNTAPSGKVAASGGRSVGGPRVSSCPKGFERCIVRAGGGGREQKRLMGNLPPVCPRVPRRYSVCSCVCVSLSARVAGWTRAGQYGSVRRGVRLMIGPCYEDRRVTVKRKEKKSRGGRKECVR